MTKQTVCQSNSGGPIRFVTAGLSGSGQLEGFPLVRGATLTVRHLHPVMVSRDALLGFTKLLSEPVV